MLEHHSISHPWVGRLSTQEFTAIFESVPYAHRLSLKDWHKESPILSELVGMAGSEDFQVVVGVIGHLQFFFAGSYPSGSTIAVRMKELVRLFHFLQLIQIHAKETMRTGGYVDGEEDHNRSMRKPDTHNSF